MSISPGGVVVFLCLLLLGYRLQSPLIIGLFASLVFDSTAIATIGAMGGSSPAIYTAFATLLLVSLSVRRGFLNDLSLTFSKYRTAWIIGVLIVYAIASAILFPRLFAGITTVFVTTPGMGARESPLAPVSGNVAQTAYLVQGALTFFAFAILMAKPGYLDIIRRGFLTWAIMHACLGLIDLASKIVGLGDVLAPIRTASHDFLVEDVQAGFFRIVGGFSEASSFGAVTVACLAFSFTYWRITRLPYMLVLTIILFCLLILSTATTAYVGLAIIAPFGAFAMAMSVLRGRISVQEIALVAILWCTLTFSLCLYLYNEQLFDPVVNLFEAVVVNKGMTESVATRAQWNAASLQAFVDTYGVGVGMGSSRTSSWVVATISQLGVVGALLMACLAGVLLWDMVAAKSAYADPKTLALVSGARAGALGSLAASSVSSGTAHPGQLFFIALAVVVVCRKRYAPAAAFSSSRPVQLKFNSPRG